MAHADKQIRFVVNAPSGAPPWLTSMAVGTHARITGSSPDLGLQPVAVGKRNLPDVVETNLSANTLGGTGFPAIIVNYGSAIVTPTHYDPYNGGHADLHANAVHRVNLFTREWERLNTSYNSVPGGTWSTPQGTWPDGSPAIPHTVNALQYIPRLNAMACCTLNANNLGTSLVRIGFFSFATLQWKYSPMSPVQFPDNSSFAVYDETNDCIYTEGGAGGGAFMRYALNGGDGTTGTWTSFSNVNNATQDAVAAIAPPGTLDPVKPILVCTAFHNSTTLRAVDLTNPAGGSVVLNQVNRPAVSSRHAWDWCAPLNGFIYHRDGANVHLVQKTSGAWNTGNYTWTNLLSGANTFVPPSYAAANGGNPSGGPYQKARVARWGSVSALIHMNAYSGPVMAFRLS